MESCIGKIVQSKTTTTTFSSFSLDSERQLENEFNYGKKVKISTLESAKFFLCRSSYATSQPDSRQALMSKKCENCKTTQGINKKSSEWEGEGRRERGRKTEVPVYNIGEVRMKSKPNEEGGFCWLGFAFIVASSETIDFTMRHTWSLISGQLSSGTHID